MTGIATLLRLITLSIRLHQARRPGTFDQNQHGSVVAITWKDLQKSVGVAPATLGKAISLLEAWGAMAVKKVGRSARCELVGVETVGHWCKLAQTFLEANGDPVSRFKDLPGTLPGLNALKLYVVLIALRSSHHVTTALSFTAITKWTGIRREDIRTAWDFLESQQLAAISPYRDHRHSAQDAADRSQRHAIVGLTPGWNPRARAPTQLSFDPMQQEAEEPAAAQSNVPPVRVPPPPEFLRVPTEGRGADGDVPSLKTDHPASGHPVGSPPSGHLVGGARRGRRPEG